MRMWRHHPQMWSGHAQFNSCWSSQMKLEKWGFNAWTFLKLFVYSLLGLAESNLNPDLKSTCSKHFLTPSLWPWEKSPNAKADMNAPNYASARLLLRSRDQRRALVDWAYEGWSASRILSFLVAAFCLEFRAGKSIHPSLLRHTKTRHGGIYSLQEGNLLRALGKIEKSQPFCGYKKKRRIRC